MRKVVAHALEGGMSENAREAGWQPSLRYPDASITALDPRFKKYHMPLTNVEQL